MTSVGNDGPQDPAEAAHVGAVAEISFYLLSESGGAELALQYGPSAVQAIREFIGLFGEADGNAEGDGESDTFNIDAVQTASPDLKAALALLVTHHATAAPHLHRLKKLVSDIPDNKHFLLLPQRPQSTAEMFEVERWLNRLNQGSDESDGLGGDDLFELLLEHYDMDNPRTDRLTMIGAKPKEMRTCRFCRRTAAEGATFKSVAHAIPTALGNDHLKLAEECDECNGYFGRETEPSLIGMLDVPRALLGTQGRGKNGGRPELRFQEGKLHHDGQAIRIESRNVVHDAATGQLAVELGQGAIVVPVAVYRALVKIALSVVDESVLPSLQDTISWVRYGHPSDRPLPKVAVAIVNLPPNPSAQIVVYRRRAPHMRLPHLVGEFRLGCFIYVFAVPFSQSDGWDLIGFFDDADFQGTFKHLAAAPSWKQYDLSGLSKVALKPTLRFNPNSQPPAPRDPGQ